MRIGDAMTNPHPVATLEELVSKVDRLHSGPGVAQRILALLRDPEFDLLELATCLEHDPALTARILRLVNSSKYGVKQKIGSIRQAANFLGRRSLQLLTLSFSLLDRFAKGPHAKLYLDYWKRALTMATVIGRLAPDVPDVSHDEAYSAGLLSDVGILALSQVSGNQYAATCLSVSHGPELVAAEIELLGFAHPTFGACLLEKWGLPEQVVSAVRSHHDADENSEPLDRLVHAGWLMSEALWTPNSPHVLAARKMLQEQYRIGLDEFIELAIACRGEVQDSAKQFGLKMEAGFDSKKLVDEARRLALESALEAAMELDSLEAVVDKGTP
jgi:HD-like signal output (HDOD) protein